MVTIRDTPDCGNAPRKEILRDLVVAIAEADAGSVSALVADDVEWTIVGHSVVAGRDAVGHWIAGLSASREVVFGALITHGREASADGTLISADGTRRAFCHVLRFAGAAKTARIVGVRTYLITETPPVRPHRS